MACPLISLTRSYGIICTRGARNPPGRPSARNPFHLRHCRSLRPDPVSAGIPRRDIDVGVRGLLSGECYRQRHLRRAWYGCNHHLHAGGSAESGHSWDCCWAWGSNRRSGRVPHWLRGSGYPHQWPTPGKVLRPDAEAWFKGHVSHGCSCQSHLLPVCSMDGRSAGEGWEVLLLYSAREDFQEPAACLSWILRHAHRSSMAWNERMTCVNTWAYGIFLLLWGCSSIGRAFDWQSKGSGFESHQLHHLLFRRMQAVVPPLFGRV